MTAGWLSGLIQRQLQNARASAFLRIQHESGLDDAAIRDFECKHGKDYREQRYAASTIAVRATP